MNAPRIAAATMAAGMLLLAPAWMFLTMLGGNGMNTRQGNVLLGGMGACLLLVLVAGPWLASNLAKRLQASLPLTVAAIAALCAAALAVLLPLALATFVLLGVLAG